VPPTVELEAAAALEAWGLEGAPLRRLASGHINATYLVEPDVGPRRILQRLSPIFGPELHEDIEAITARLEAAGLATPRLVPTLDGRLFLERSGALHRVLTHLEGETLLAADSPARCERAGELLGRFHAALWTCDHVFRHRRVGVHDTPAHLARLRAALEARREHRRYAEVEPVGREILAAAAGLPAAPALPWRVVHGDPKVSNFLFGEAGEAIALLDLDTLARMPLDVELGDAARSFCAPLGEEVLQEVEPAYFEALLRGYASGVGGRPGAAELAAVPAATARIAVELAARFCRDALEESYFGWDRARFPSASEHNLLRARAQLALAHSVQARLTGRSPSPRGP
jgi:Ser/Thr protein kinase RdoA (MazF antagonist)